MHNFIQKLIALAIIPCLSVDPLLASSLRQDMSTAYSTSEAYHTSGSLFEREAIVSAIVFFRRAFSRQVSVETHQTVSARLHLSQNERDIIHVGASAPSAAAKAWLDHSHATNRDHRLQHNTQLLLNEFHVGLDEVIVHIPSQIYMLELFQKRRARAVVWHGTSSPPRGTLYETLEKDSSHTPLHRFIHESHKQIIKSIGALFYLPASEEDVVATFDPMAELIHRGVDKLYVYHPLPNDPGAMVLVKGLEKPKPFSRSGLYLVTSLLLLLIASPGEAYGIANPVLDSLRWMDFWWIGGLLAGSSIMMAITKFPPERLIQESVRAMYRDIKPYFDGSFPAATSDSIKPERIQESQALLLQALDILSTSPRTDANASLEYDTHIRMAENSFLLKDYADAEDHLRRASDVGHRVPLRIEQRGAFWALLGRVSLATGKNEDAQAVLDEAASIYTNLRLSQPIRPTGSGRDIPDYQWRLIKSNRNGDLKRHFITHLDTILMLRTRLPGTSPQTTPESQRPVAQTQAPDESDPDTLELRALLEKAQALRNENNLVAAKQTVLEGLKRGEEIKASLAVRLPLWQLQTEIFLQEEKYSEAKDILEYSRWVAGEVKQGRFPKKGLRVPNKERQVIEKRRLEGTLARTIEQHIDFAAKILPHIQKMIVENRTVAISAENQARQKQRESDAQKRFETLLGDDILGLSLQEQLKTVAPFEFFNKYPSLSNRGEMIIHLLGEEQIHNDIIQRLARTSSEIGHRPFTLILNLAILLQAAEAGPVVESQVIEWMKVDRGLLSDADVESNTSDLLSTGKMVITVSLKPLGSKIRQRTGDSLTVQVNVQKDGKVLLSDVYMAAWNALSSREGLRPYLFDARMVRRNFTLQVNGETIPLQDLEDQTAPGYSVFSLVSGDPVGGRAGNGNARFHKGAPIKGLEDVAHDLLRDPFHTPAKQSKVSIRSVVSDTADRPLERENIFRSLALAFLNDAPKHHLKAAGYDDSMVDNILQNRPFTSYTAVLTWLRSLGSYATIFNPRRRQFEEKLRTLWYLGRLKPAHRPANFLGADLLTPAINKTHLFAMASQIGLSHAFIARKLHISIRHFYNKYVPSDLPVPDRFYLDMRTLINKKLSLPVKNKHQIAAALQQAA